jgi:hypothetical protein
MGEPEKITFEKFWPYYLAEHSRGVTRAFHLLATLAWMALLAAAIATRTWWLALLMPVAAYGLAWFSPGHQAEGVTGFGVSFPPSLRLTNQ